MSGKKNQNILDIGCAPGSWIQVVKELAKGKVAITGIDILPMAKIEGITFLQKDLLEVNDDDLNENFDLVLSDIAPNITGIDACDIPAMLEIAENISNIAENLLKPRGSLIMKLFQGSGSDNFIKELKKMYNKVSIIKPKASRPKSREIYLVALEYNLNQRKSL